MVRKFKINERVLVPNPQRFHNREWFHELPNPLIRPVVDYDNWEHPEHPYKVHIWNDLYVWFAPHSLGKYHPRTLNGLVE